MTSGLLDAKLTLPVARPGSLLRLHLVDRVRADERRVVSIAAPAGYGKSTFLRQWADHEDRAVAWVSLEPTDDDEAVVLGYIAAALERVEPLAVGPLPADRSSGTLHMAALSRLGDAMWRMGQRVVLMLDDVHHLRSASSADALGWLAEHLPPHIRLVVSGRGRAPLPIARLRARGQLLELDARDLAMSAAEAADVLEQAGVRLRDDRIEQLTSRAEGWPAGIYLAALALRARGDDGPAPDLDASGRYVAEFLRDELLDRSPMELIEFLCGTAPLVRFDPELCDHALGRRGSADVLAELERTNLFLIPLGDRARTYRYHHLFRESLLIELRRRWPEQEALVLHRAAEWSAHHDDPEAAIEYAHLAGDDELVARLLAAHALRVYRTGRITTLERWFGWFDAERLEQAPLLAILGAWVRVLSGRTRRAERWADALLPVLADLDVVERAWYATLRSVMGRMTPEELLEESRLARDTMPDGDGWRATAFLGGGALHAMIGDVESADRLLIRAIDIGLDDGGIPATTTALALRARIAIARGAWEIASELARRARALIAEHGLETYATSILAYAVSARVAIHKGALEIARADLASAQRHRPVLTAALPYMAAVVRIEIAQAYLTLGEHAGARLMLAEVDEILKVRPGISPVATEVAALRARAGATGSGRAGAATLTTAELRLLGYLPSHLSFREIADRLVVSINTVKTQAISIYGKLGVSSRSAAIEAAVESGLLDPAVTRFPPLRPELRPPRG